MHWKGSFDVLQSPTGVDCCSTQQDYQTVPLHGYSPVSSHMLRSWDYSSFAVAILSQNKEIHIAESISVSMKVIIEGFFPVMTSCTIWPPVLQLRV